MTSSEIKLLIVDDEKDVCLSIVNYFSVLGYKTEACFSGQEALERLSEERFDLVVTDVCMPQFDGIELLKAIREQHHNLPKVYVISGYAQQPIADIYNFGADGFFRKPFDSRSMLDAVRKATMSLQDQWKRAPSAEPHNELIFLGKLADSQIKFARGGFSALTSPGEWRVGDPIRFSIEVTDAEFLDICGTGIVRWKELNNEKTMLCSGIEITYIEEQFRLAFIQWLQKNSGIPFIPKL